MMLVIANSRISVGISNWDWFNLFPSLCTTDQSLTDVEEVITTVNVNDILKMRQNAKNMLQTVTTTNITRILK